LRVRPTPGPQASPEAGDQRVARRLDEVEHGLEAVLAAVVRVGDFAHRERRRDLEEQAEVARVARGPQALELREVVAVHREDPVEARKVSRDT
jgi:hypothetical protein